MATGSWDTAKFQTDILVRLGVLGVMTAVAGFWYASRKAGSKKEWCPPAWVIVVSSLAIALGYGAALVFNTQVDPDRVEVTATSTAVFPAKDTRTAKVVKSLSVVTLGAQIIAMLLLIMWMITTTKSTVGQDMAAAEMASGAAKAASGAVSSASSSSPTPSFFDNLF